VLLLVLTNVTCSQQSKICYAYFGFVSDRGFTYYQNLGRAWVDAQVGTTSEYAEGVAFQARSRQDEIINGFVNSSCQVIVLGSDLMQNLAVDHAIANPNIRFVCLTCQFVNPDDEPPNLAAVEALIYEPGFIGGIIAATQEGVQKIGYVGSDYLPAAFRNINAFALGAQFANPNVTLILTHAGSWYDPWTEQVAGKRLVIQQGIDLIAYDSDSDTLVSVAREMGIFSVAIKVDGTASYGESNLMSRMFNWNGPLQSVIEGAIGIGDWATRRAENRRVGFREDAVSIGTLSTALNTEARIAALQGVDRFKQEGDVTWCIGAAGVDVFCPADANLFSNALGAVPTDIFPCNPNITTIYPGDGECLSLAQVVTMSWLADGWVDLGRISVPSSCPAGTRVSYDGSELCVPCSGGAVSVIENQESCDLCAPGRYAVGGLECRQCKAGSFSLEAGMSACSECEPGHYAAADGSITCLACDEGYFANASGETICERCEVGTYTNVRGQQVCTSCGDLQTTQFTSATSEDECVCLEGMYRAYAGGCVPCPAGMQCDRGSDVRNLPGIIAANGTCGAGTSSTTCPFPRTLSLYMSLDSAPLKAYRCIDEESCPGATASYSSCGVFRDTGAVACGKCVDDAFLNRDGQCEQCTGGLDILYLVGTVVGGAVVVCIMAIAVNRDVLMQQKGNFNLIVIGGVFLTALQTTIVFNQLSMEWADPLKSAMVVSSLAGFDLGSMKLGCYLPFDPVMKFLTRQMVAPIALPILLLTISCKKLTSKETVRVDVEFANAAGTIFSAFFISVVTTSVDAFVCYDHPSAAAGSSVTIEPSVLCWDDVRHIRMVVVAVLAFLLVPTTFLVSCCYAVKKYPSVMSKHDDRQRWFAHTFRFLFFRFRPDAYFYGLLLLMKNMTLCLIPASFSGKVGIQVLLICGIIVSFGMFQATTQPFRAKFVNKMDSLTSTLLILILHCGILRTELAVNKNDIAVLSTIAVGTFLILLIVTAGISIKAKLWPERAYYHFLCHHKRDAATQVRYLQMQIVSKLRRTCFLDSDHLKDLSKLFETVKTSVQHFLIYLTQDTLSRPWCVGEVVIAMESKLKTTKIIHSSYRGLPQLETAEDVHNFVASGVNFMDYNMRSDHLIKGLKWITGAAAPTIRVKEDWYGSSIFRAVITELGGAEAGKQMKITMPVEVDSLLVSTDITDMEAIAAGGVLVDLIQHEPTNTLEGGAVLLADVSKDGLSAEMIRKGVAKARAVAVILTAETLDSLQQIEVIMVATLGKACVIPLVTKYFQFPGDAYYSTVLPSIYGDDHEEAERAMRSFFEQIAVTFSTHAALTTIRAEMRQFLSRIPKEPVQKERTSVIDAHVPTNRFSTSSTRSETSGGDGKRANSFRTWSRFSFAGAADPVKEEEDHSLTGAEAKNWWVGLVKHTTL